MPQLLLACEVLATPPLLFPPTHPPTLVPLIQTHPLPMPPHPTRCCPPPPPTPPHPPGARRQVCARGHHAGQGERAQAHGERDRHQLHRVHLPAAAGRAGTLSTCLAGSQAQLAPPFPSLQLHARLRHPTDCCSILRSTQSVRWQRQSARLSLSSCCLADESHLCPPCPATGLRLCTHAAAVRRARAGKPQGPACFTVPCCRDGRGRTALQQGCTASYRGLCRIAHPARAFSSPCNAHRWAAATSGAISWQAPTSCAA